MYKNFDIEDYASFDGTTVHILYQAIHFETGEHFIVFQERNKPNRVWTLPKDTFLREICGNLHTNNTFISSQRSSAPIFFPQINYTNELLPLVDGNTFSKSVKAMITLLTNKSILSNSVFSDLKTDDDIENLILRKIRSYSSETDTEEIFHLIQTWGGITGRGVYIFEEQFNWTKIAPYYQNLIEKCLSTKHLSNTSLDILLATIKEFNTSVKHIGISFITKHVRYWLYHSLGENALPIYDRIMAGCVMRKRSVQLKHLTEYWKTMIEKANQHKISLMALERHIFKYAYALQK